MFISPYDTLAGKSYITSDIKKEIKLSKIDGTLLELRTVEKQQPVFGVVGISPYNKNIPSFTHPLIMEEFAENSVIIDTRPYIKKEPDGRFSYTNISEYKFQLERGMLTNHWIKHPSELAGAGDIAPMAFCRWLTEAIVRRLGLDTADQVKVTIITLFYWYSLFRTTEFNERDKNGVMLKLGRIFNIPSNLVMGVMENVRYMPTIKDYVDGLKFGIGNVRLDDLNVVLLFTMLGGSWFGLNAKEIIGIATEHPPTFMSMVLNAVNSRAFKKSILGKVVADVDKRGLGADFTKSIYNMLKGYTS